MGDEEVRCGIGGLFNLPNCCDVFSTPSARQSRQRVGLQSLQHDHDGQWRRDAMHLRNDDVRSDNLQDERGLLQKGITCEDLSSIGVPREHWMSFVITCGKRRRRWR